MKFYFDALSVFLLSFHFKEDSLLKKEVVRGW